MDGRLKTHNGYYINSNGRISLKDEGVWELDYNSKLERNRNKLGLS